MRYGRTGWPEKSAPEAREEAAGVPWSGRGFRLEHDRIAEGIEAPDEPLGDPVLVPAIQVVGAKFLEVDCTGQQTFRANPPQCQMRRPSISSR